MNYTQDEINSKVKRIYQDFTNKNLVVYNCKNYKIKEMMRGVPTYSGIIVLFDENNGKKRIVFVGNSTNVRRRVREFFQDKRRNATLKRHVGNAFISKEIGQEIADLWWDYQNSRRFETKDYELIEKKYIEKVHDYIKNNLSFVVIHIDEGRQEEFAQKILSTLSWCKSFINEDWLGKYSTKRQVREAGLWAIKTHKKEYVMDDDDFEYLENSLRGEE